MKTTAGVCWRFLFIILILSAIPASMFAQSWSINTSAGQANYNIAPISTVSRTGVFGVGFNQDRRLFQTSVGVPLSNQDVTWVVSELGDRFAFHRRGLTAGVDTSMLIHAQRDPVSSASGQGLMAEFLPVISHNLGAGVLELRSGPRWYGARLGGTNFTRTLWSTDFNGVFRPAPRLQLAGDIRHDRNAKGEAYTRMGLSAAGVLGRIVVRGSLGDWIHNPGGEGIEWGASAGLSIKPNVWIVATARHDNFDPTFLAPPRTSWSAGMSFQFGNKRESQVRTSEIQDKSNVVFRLSLREAGTAPSIAGDFTNWAPVRMSRYDQEWRVSISLAPGVYHFAFRDEDGRWFVPPGTPNRIADGMGGWQVVLVVQ